MTLTKKTLAALLLFGALSSSSLFGIEAAKDLDAETITLSPTSPDASWPPDGTSNYLSPNYTASITVDVKEEEDGYSLFTGPDPELKPNDPNLILTVNGNKYSFTNTAADAVTVTLTVKCKWKKSAGGGGGGGITNDIKDGTAEAEFELLDSVVDWHFEHTHQWYENRNDLPFSITITDSNGFGLENFDLIGYSPIDINPQNLWEITPSVVVGAPQWFLAATVWADSPSKGKIKFEYNDGSPEERISNTTIGFLKILIETTTQLTLLDNLEIKITTLPEEQDFVHIDEITFEMKKTTQAQWHEIQKGLDLIYNKKATVAGYFDVRVSAEIQNSIYTHTTGIDNKVEVMFPDWQKILAGDGVQTRMDQAWSETKNATTATSRREEGYYITLNTSSGEYGITAHTIGTDVANNQGASWDNATFPRPPDSVGNPTPLDQPIYTVGWFHTHTPTTHRAVGRGVGPSGADLGWSAHASINIPGYAYDYIEATVGSGMIPAGHPLDSSAKVYEIIPPERRPTQ